MKHYLRFTGAIAGLMALLAAPAQAQPVCGPRAEIVGKLSANYEEQQAAVGLASNGNLLEVFTSKAGTWTVLFTRPDGITCFIAAGNNWQDTREPATVAGQEL